MEKMTVKPLATVVTALAALLLAAGFGSSVYGCHRQRTPANRLPVSTRNLVKINQPITQSPAKPTANHLRKPTIRSPAKIQSHQTVIPAKAGIHPIHPVHPCKDKPGDKLGTRERDSLRNSRRVRNTGVAVGDAVGAQASRNHRPPDWLLPVTALEVVGLGILEEISLLRNSNVTRAAATYNREEPVNCTAPGY